ncbi:MAG: gluconate 2-dehydrogenase subunit 3 family protein, partial [Massilia sp.]
AGAAALGTSASALGAAAAAAPAAAPAHTADSQAATYLFFRADEARFIEAATERLIPPDANGPGALQAGVPNYIDRQLAGAWGAGERLYRSGPWHPGLPGQGYQLPFTPAELFRNAVRGVAEDLKTRHNTTFDKLSGDAQDSYLQSLQTGQQSLNGVPAHTFFESLLGLSIEGYFSDPIYGGNKDMAAWRMIGFPGAYASFYDLVDQHGIAFTRPPISIGETARGVIHLHPVKEPTASGARQGGK